MDEQFWTPVAVALVSTAAETLADGVRTAFTALVGLVRRRFADKPEAQRLLDTDPAAGPDRVVELSSALRAAAAEDAAFAEALRDAWTELTEQIKAHGGTINQIIGPVSGTVVQARDIHGDITFRPTTR